ncbi:hypothetical protein K504DRAFT_450542 [Pleomassaria siparia CBS 279.74]|uniref:Uncharacterized protein n=1 Tax=Pleomassaria siparia CBS 279.74 TaxID=1314801 RepID=A0A6G1KM45_9PLEO|nr:hypothetical protein K504DRAFT_450542 [Pleomassaria siparia CBS 279.74]
MHALSAYLVGYAFISTQIILAASIHRDVSQSPDMMSHLQRQTKCEQDYGVYPVYTGSCTATSALTVPPRSKSNFADSVCHFLVLFAQERDVLAQTIETFP